jgi:1-aminocyclopropane-1-carboxylate synthase
MLSSRGTAAASPARRQLLWDVMADHYCTTANVNGFVNLGVAENALMHKELINHINGSLRLRSALANFFNGHFEPFKPVQAAHINVSNGVTASIERCAFELGDPGDSFLLGRPYYGTYPSDLGDRAYIKTVTVAFDGVDPFSVAAVACYEAALLEAKHRSGNATKVRALVLCSPHNPLGRCYPREMLVALMSLCQKYQIHLICDEIYALSVFPNPERSQAERFTSVMAINPAGIIDPALVHVLWGLSKDFGANGLRIGCVVSQANPSLIGTLDAHAPYSFPSALLDYMACCILEDQLFLQYYITENQYRLAENYTFTIAFLREHGVQFYAGTNAGVYVWANLGETWTRRKQLSSSIRSQQTQENHAVVSCRMETSCSDVSLCARKEATESDITEEIMARLLTHKVYLASGGGFGSEHPGWFRIVFSQPRALLEEGLRRMVAALEQ